jgi:hypothetical protein
MFEDRLGGALSQFISEEDVRWPEALQPSSPAKECSGPEYAKK